MSNQRKLTSEARMPVLFVGHGSPMNAIEDNQWSRGFSALASNIPRPKAIVVISAHWYTPGTYVTSNEFPATIHDFSGFPQALNEVNYPAKGLPDLAREVHTLMSNNRGSLTDGWGLDHGTWSVLRNMYPNADVPVIQLSIDRRLREADHFEMARSLADLRNQGVLIIGSGNIVHNLGDAISRRRSNDLRTPPWARQFDDTVKNALLQRDVSTLLTVASQTEAGEMSHPSPDHWLPLIYALAATDDNDVVHFSSEGFDLGSLSMRNVMFQPNPV